MVLVWWLLAIFTNTGNNLTLIGVGNIQEQFINLVSVAYEQQIHQNINVATDSLAINFKVSRQCREINTFALQMRQHCPKPSKPGCRNSKTQLRDISFQIGTDQVFQPGHAIGIGLCQVTFRKPSPLPSLVCGYLAIFILKNKEQ
jgi:hypothetical protein